MSRIYTSADQLIGATPLLELSHIEREHRLKARILAKLEYFNPAGSVKDRIAKAMIDDGEARGLLKPGSVIIEPTSGNTGIGLASVAAARGYRIIIVMPDTMSVERRQLMKAYGAELVLTEGALGMKGAIAKAGRSGQRDSGQFYPRAVRQPGQPRCTQSHHGAGNLGRYRRQGRYLYRRRGHGRHRHRRGRLSQGAGPCHPRNSRGACGLSGAEQGHSRAAQDPGHRRRFCARSSGHSYL